MLDKMRKNFARAFKIDKEASYYYLYWMRTFIRINAVTKFRSMTRSNIFGNWFFSILPLGIFAGNAFIITNNSLLYNPELDLAYIDDITHSVVGSILLFIAYALSSFYPDKISHWIERGVVKDSYQDVVFTKKDKMISGIIIVTILTICIVCCHFLYVSANATGKDIWMIHLSPFGRFLNQAMATFIWYHSFCVICMILASGGFIYWAFKKDCIVYKKEYYNKNLSVVDCVDIFYAALSYGIFYVLGTILIILNDKMQARKGIINFFADDCSALGLMILVFCVLIFVIVPMYELYHFMSNKKVELLSDYDQRIERATDKEKSVLTKERNAIALSLPVIPTFTNKLFFIASVVIPFIGVVVQTAAFFRNG